ncbi:alpha/beta hydrolase [Cytophagales bacterium LB-30]|uniref:Alpha/beta hydrolase n=2 Tax=Shiella aurantiaca TaxID=3058365 RepID=A0ABT8F1G1_9BACT|nr:alpha/beta hydrolase [Shiella aurantiaca]
MTPKEMNKEFNTPTETLRSYTYTLGEREMHYVATLDKGQSLAILFLHGSPGSWSAYKEYLKADSLEQKAQLLSADRPGFGYSGYGEAEPSLEKQAQLLAPILEAHAHQKIILVGHSLGGPLIVKMAMMYPEKIHGLVLLAGSVAPELEPKEKFRPFLAGKVIRRLIPGSFRASNEEILPLKGELEKMLPDWKNIQIPVWILHGEKDQLVPVGNMDFALERLENAPTYSIRLPEENHFIPWTAPQEVSKAIQNLMEEIGY